MQIGIDIQEVEQLGKIVGTNKMERIFSKQELEYIEQKNNRLETIAGLYCAKEAFFKATGTGIKISQLTEVETKHSKTGAPYYELSSCVVKENNLENADISLSISHTKTTAVAVCIIHKM